MNRCSSYNVWVLEVIEIIFYSFYRQLTMNGLDQEIQINRNTISTQFKYFVTK